MSLTDGEIEKIYQIQKKLSITYKSATTDEQRKRVYLHLKKIEEIINDIENGKQINSEQLNLFSYDLKKVEPAKNSHSNNDERITYIAKVESNTISESFKDFEMDQIYSFLLYFDKNISAPFSQNYLQLEYNLNKKRETFFAHYDNISLLLKEYIEDINLLTSMQSKEQIELYKTRINNQKKYFFIKLSELLHEVKDLVDEILKEFYSGINSILNPNDEYINKYPKKEKNDFDDMKMIDIVIEIQYFINDFISIIRMPDFRNI